MDVRHDVVLLLVVGVVELGKVDRVKLALQVHLVVVLDLLDTVLCVAHDVQKFVEEDVRVVLLALLERLKLRVVICTSQTRITSA